MRTLLICLLILLCVSGTLQKKGRTRKRRNSTVVFPVPRFFVGNFPTIEVVSNGTSAPNSTQPPRDLQLQHNDTAEYLQGALSTRVIPTVYLLVVAVGVPANVAILCALASKIRKVSSAILYCSLAVSDLLLLLSLFFKAHYHFHGNDWALGEAACRLVTACFYGNLYCSAQTLACISVKRYLAVVHPFWYKTLPKRMCTAWVTLSVWVVFALAIIPELLIQQTYKLQHLGLTTCHDVLPLQPDSRVFLLSYNLILTILGLLLPLVVSVICYVRIVCELNRSHLDWMMYIKASSLVFIIFLLCFTPAGILHLLHYVQLFSRIDKLYVHFNVAVCLCCLHACLDPFLFILMSKSAGSRTYFRPFKSTTLSVSV